MAAKKLELIFQRNFLRRIVDILKQDGVPGYTITEILAGNGPCSGDVCESGSISINEYLYMFIVCSKEEADILVVALKPYIQEISGRFYISDISIEV